MFLGAIMDVVINAANLKNNHIYLREILSIFPKDSIGGGNAYSKGMDLKISYIFRGQQKSFLTDIAGDKKIFRKRSKSSGTGMLLADLNIKVGDRLVFKMIDTHHFKVRIA